MDPKNGSSFCFGCSIDTRIWTHTTHHTLHIDVWPSYQKKERKENCLFHWSAISYSPLNASREPKKRKIRGKLNSSVNLKFWTIFFGLPFLLLLAIQTSWRSISCVFTFWSWIFFLFCSNLFRWATAPGSIGTYLSQRETGERPLLFLHKPLLLVSHILEIK